MYQIGKTLEISLVTPVSGIGWRSKGTRSFEETLYFSEQPIPSTRLDESKVPRTFGAECGPYFP